MRSKIKKHSTYKRWTIYECDGTESYKFMAFLPEQSPRQMDVPEWEDDSLEAIKAFIDSY